MTAYLINHLRQPGVLHREVLEYLDRVQATLDPFGGKFIAQGGEPQVLEGAWAGSVIVLSFPDMTKVRAWYKSAPYQKILHLRTDHLIGDVILVDGVDPDHTPGKFARSYGTCRRRASLRVRAHASPTSTWEPTWTFPEPIMRRPLRRHSPVRSLV
jgi:uncharacterized protein (DUF1330 family)